MSDDSVAVAEVTTAGPLTENRSPSDLTSGLLAIIERAASDPRVDVDKMERLLQMQFQVIARAAEASFNQALAKLQPRLPRITKNGAIILKDGTTKISYAKYDDICDLVMPLLSEEGFTVSYSSRLVSNGERMEVVGTFRHIDGHSDCGSVFLPLTDDTGAKNKVQGAGSIYSYGRRYVLCQYLNLVMEGEDDDGMGGNGDLPLAEAQVLFSEITSLIKSIKDSGKSFNEAAFLECVHADAVENIAIGEYRKAISMLQQKQRKKT